MPDIGQPSETNKNSPNEIRDGVVSDATRFPGGFIDQQITQAGAAVQIVGQFQLNNASFVESFDVSSQHDRPQGLAFKPDGSQLYVVGRTSGKVFQYSLSTAFDITTASVSRSFDVSPQANSATGLAFKPDGSQLYVVGLVSDEVFQYGLSTAFDISTASFSQSFSVRSQDAVPTGLAFNLDGSQLYVVGEENVNVYQYGLSTAFDVSTATFSQSFDVSSQDATPEGLTLKPDGSKLYVVGSSNENVYQYSLSTAFNISTASFSQSFDVSSQDASPQGLVFKPDGSHLYVVGEGNDNVYQYAVGFVAGELG